MVRIVESERILSFLWRKTEVVAAPGIAWTIYLRRVSRSAPVTPESKRAGREFFLAARPFIRFRSSLTAEASLPCCCSRPNLLSRQPSQCRPS